VDLRLVQHVVRASGGDLRQCLALLQFWLGGPGARDLQRPAAQSGHHQAALLQEQEWQQGVQQGVRNVQGVQDQGVQEQQQQQHTQENQQRQQQDVHEQQQQQQLLLCSPVWCEASHGCYCTAGGGDYGGLGLRSCIEATWEEGWGSVEQQLDSAEEALVCVCVCVRSLQSPLQTIFLSGTGFASTNVKILASLSVIWLWRQVCCEA